MKRAAKVFSKYRDWLFGGLFLLLGAVFVILGGQISGLSDYWRSIFAETGGAIGLVGPIFVAERLLHRRVIEVKAEVATARSETAEVRTAVNNLDQEVRDRFAQMNINYEQRLKGAAEGSFKDLLYLYNQAAVPGWIDSRGLRVATSLDDMWLLVSAEPASEGEALQSVKLAFEGAGLEPIGESVAWSSDEQTVPVFVQLAAGLRPRPFQDHGAPTNRRFSRSAAT